MQKHHGRRATGRVNHGAVSCDDGLAVRLDVHSRGRLEEHLLLLNRHVDFVDVLLVWFALSLNLFFARRLLFLEEDAAQLLLTCLTLHRISVHLEAGYLVEYDRGLLPPSLVSLHLQLEQ